MKKTLENYHKILTVSKHSHSEVGLIHVIILGASQKACKVGDVGCPHGGGCQPPTRGGCWLPTVWGIGSPLQEGKPIDPCVAKIEFGKAGEVEQLPKRSRGFPHVSFQRKSLWLSTTKNLELRNIQTPSPHLHKSL